MILSEIQAQAARIHEELRVLWDLDISKTHVMNTQVLSEASTRLWMLYTQLSVNAITSETTSLTKPLQARALGNAAAVLASIMAVSDQMLPSINETLDDQGHDLGRYQFVYTQAVFDLVSSLKNEAFTEENLTSLGATVYMLNLLIHAGSNSEDLTDRMLHVARADLLERLDFPTINMDQDEMIRGALSSIDSEINTAGLFQELLEIRLDKLRSTATNPGDDAMVSTVDAEQKKTPWGKGIIA